MYTIEKGQLVKALATQWPNDVTVGKIYKVSMVGGGVVFFRGDKGVYIPQAALTLKPLYRFDERIK